MAGADLQRVPEVHLAASVWALVGGFVLIGDAVRIRRLRRESCTPPVDDGEGGSRDREGE